LDVRCLVRKGSEYFWLNDTGASYFFGDLRDPTSLSRALRDVKYVIAASGVRVDATDNHHGNVTRDGHIALFNAAKTRGVQHVVFISCMGVHHPEAPVMAAYKAAEDHLIQSGLSYTILRPGLFTANFADLARRVEHNGSVFLPGKPGAKVSPIHGRDVALMALASLEKPEAKNQILEIGGPETMSLQEAFERGCKASGLEPHFWPMPPWALSALSLAARPIGRRWQVRLRSLDAWFSHDSSVDGPALAARLGVPLTAFEEGVKADFENRHPSEDPTAREEKVVHRQFTSIVYEPGSIKLSELPQGPPPRRD
jgi:uncharacterized protein YbjT (DUF2867 family)